MNTLGIDVGGANLKAVYVAGIAGDGESNLQSVNVVFPMWERWKELPNQLQQIAETLGVSDSDQVAVTMTGELADCFASRRDGVGFIVRAVRTAFRNQPVAFYLTDGSWSDGESASQDWELFAASNWHAMAQSAACLLPEETGLMIDIGSTTTDVIPIIGGVVEAIGRTDFQRLRNSELIYAGAGRTPICSLIQYVDLEQGRVNVARELFATTDDALLWLERVAEDDRDLSSADGRSRSKADAGRRLARMVCSEPQQIGVAAIDTIAATTIKAYQTLLVNAIAAVINAHRIDLRSVLLVGAGGQLAEEVLNQHYRNLHRIRFSDIVGKDCSVSGPAYAVAVLHRQVQT